MIFFRLVWWWLAFSLRRPLLATVLSVVVAGLALGAWSHTQAGMDWILRGPEIRLVNPETSEVVGTLRPVRIVAFAGRMALDAVGRLW